MRVCMVTYSFYEGDTRVIQYATALAGRGDRWTCWRCASKATRASRSCRA